ncbi:MAG TPA: rubredoxin [Firmicutes bacterium]|jgi:rubredoxin|nr:rubredoxin [Bacillota bacterium]
MKKWRCGVCRYVHDGDHPPAACPKCNAPAEKFTEIPAEESALIERARRTNHYHVELLALLEEVKTIAELGLEDKLDPPCVSLFQKAIQSAVELRQAIKAELLGHMQKGKWG